MTRSPLVLSLASITKQFGSLVANDGIDLELRRGEILALVGENGAGKTTLMNILFGHYIADQGEVRVASSSGELEALQPGSPSAALKAGIGMVHQHFALAESLTVLENVVLGTQPLRAPRLNPRALRMLERLMEESGLVVRPSAPVFQLSVGEKQRVEILKVLYREARILILDEPTAVLAPQEVRGFFGVLRRLAERGLSIVFISHKLQEVLAIADRVAVLRHGRKVADQPVAGADGPSLATLMIGHEIIPSRREPREPGEVLLELDRITLQPDTGVGLAEATLTVRAGEIVGIAGVSGNGQAALAGLMAGTLLASAGRITVAGFSPVPSPRGMHDAGVSSIPEDRHREGIVGSLSVADNLAIETLGSPEVQRAGFLRLKRMRARAAKAISAYDIRCRDPDQPIRLLSGGNIQKVILARVLDREPRVILANQPTRGLDVGASAEVHARLLGARMRGAGVLLISEDLDELLTLSDRLAVIARGRLTKAEPVDTLTRERIGVLMTAHVEDEVA